MIFRFQLTIFLLKERFEKCKKFKEKTRRFKKIVFIV